MYTVIYTEDFREGFVSIKVSKWVKDVEELSEIALDDPQSAYAAFTKALYAIVECWTYLQSTVPDISHLFAPLEHVIMHKFISAIVGRQVSETERKLFVIQFKVQNQSTRCHNW